MAPIPSTSLARAAVRSAVALVLPTTCAGCGVLGESWCSDCRRAVGRTPPRGHRRGVPSWSATAFDGPVRAAVTAYKDRGRRDLLHVLAPLLAASVAAALTEDPALRRARTSGGPVLLVPVPASARAVRRRGEDPVAALAGRVAALVDDPSVEVAPVLRHVRPVTDQSRLSRPARAANLAGATRVDPRWVRRVDQAACVLLDDVVTTGATLDEAARALRSAGARYVVAATVAATP